MPAHEAAVAVEQFQAVLRHHQRGRDRQSAAWGNHLLGVGQHAVRVDGHDRVPVDGYLSMDVAMLYPVLAMAQELELHGGRDKPSDLEHADIVLGMGKGARRTAAEAFQHIPLN